MNNNLAIDILQQNEINDNIALDQDQANAITALQNNDIILQNNINTKQPLITINSLNGN